MATMNAVFLGIVLWGLLVAAAWKCSTIWPTIHRYDRVGAVVFFAVVGLPFFVAGLALIAQPIVA
jgi:hypothetical protein